MKQYYVMLNGQQVGPVAESALVEGFYAGTYPAGTIVWCQGMAGWAPIESLPAIAAAAQAAAPAAAASGKSHAKIWILLVLVLALGAGAWFMWGGSGRSKGKNKDKEEEVVKRTFSSMDEIKAFADEKIKEIQGRSWSGADKYSIRRKFAAIKEVLGIESSEYYHSKESSAEALFEFMASCGEVGALEFLMQQDVFKSLDHYDQSKVIKAAYKAAATHGHVDCLLYIRQNSSIEPGDTVAVEAAATHGQQHIIGALKDVMEREQFIYAAGMSHARVSFMCDDTDQLDDPLAELNLYANSEVSQGQFKENLNDMKDYLMQALH